MRQNFRPAKAITYSFKKAILNILIDSAEHTRLFETPFQHIKRLCREDRGIPEKTLSRWRYNRAIKYLRTHGRIEVRRRGDQTFIKLTRKGVLQTLIRRIHEEYKAIEDWDGKWRLIIWDIPEKSSKERNRIRYFVKSLGFYRLQNSVFITPYPLPNDAVEYLNVSGLTEYVRFLRVDKLDDNKRLKEYFKLN